MFIDAARFPIVYMHHDRPEEPGVDSFTVFEQLLDREMPFVLIGYPEAEHSEDHNQRKQVVLWMKANRKRLQRLVFGMVQVEPSLAKRLVAKGFAVAFRKFWSYPLIIAESDQQALSFAERLLAGEDASALSKPIME